MQKTGKLDFALRPVCQIDQARAYVRRRPTEACCGDRAWQRTFRPKGFCTNGSYAALTPTGFEGWAVLAAASDVYWLIKSLYLQKAVRLCWRCRTADFSRGGRAESTDSHRYVVSPFEPSCSRMSRLSLMTEQGLAKGIHGA